MNDWDSRFLEGYICSTRSMHKYLERYFHQQDISIIIQHCERQIASYSRQPDDPFSEGIVAANLVALGR